MNYLVWDEQKGDPSFFDTYEEAVQFIKDYFGTLNAHEVVEELDISIYKLHSTVDYSIVPKIEEVK